MVAKHERQFSGVQRADLMELFSTVPWHGDDLSSLLEALDEKKPAARKKRRLGQNFQALMSFGTDSLWQTLNAETAHVEERMTVLFDFMVNLSLRLPDEHTWKLIGVLIYKDMKEWNKLIQLDKKTFTESLKRRYKKRVRNLPDPVEWIEQLPGNPSLLLKQYPRTYAIAFPDGCAPVPCPWDPAKIANATSSFCCRGAGKDIVIPSRAADLAVVRQPPVQVQMQPDIAGLIQGAMQAILAQVQPQLRQGMYEPPGSNLAGLRFEPGFGGQPRRQPRLPAASIPDPERPAEISTSPSSAVPHVSEESGDHVAREDAPTDDDEHIKEYDEGVTDDDVSGAEYVVPKVAEASCPRVDKSVAKDLVGTPPARDAAQLPIKSANAVDMTSKFLDELTQRTQRQTLKRKADKAEAKSSGASQSNNMPPWRQSSMEVVTPHKKSVKPKPTPPKSKSLQKKPSMSHEQSRLQYLVRTGLTGRGQSFAFTYHEDGKYESAAKAHKAAKQLLAELLAKFAA